MSPRPRGAFGLGRPAGIELLRGTATAEEVAALLVALLAAAEPATAAAGPDTAGTGAAQTPQPWHHASPEPWHAAPSGWTTTAAW